MTASATPHADHIETAFLQLHFALKFWNFVASKKLSKEDFDIALVIEDPGTRISMTKDEFNTYDDLIIASEHNLSITFGAVAITLWEALCEKQNYSKGNPLLTEGDKLAALIFQIRNCFAHGTALPHWKITNPKYLIVYAVGPRSVDLRNLNGKPFRYADIGGFETLELIRNEAKNRGML